MSEPSAHRPEGTPIKRKTVFIVLPAFNEAPHIGRLLDRIDEAMEEAALRYQIIVLDDGSQDGTAEIVSEYSARLPITLRQHKFNLGLGTAIRDGLVAAAGIAEAGDVIVTMDADDTHTPGLILRMVRMIGEGYDVVIASRYQPGSRLVGVPFERRVLSYIASLLFRILFPTRGVKDFTCGYRAYRADVIQQAISGYGKSFLDQQGFQCMVDILLKLRKENLIFGEVPFVLRYDIKEGGTKMKVFQTARDTLLLVLKRRFGR